MQGLNEKKKYAGAPVDSSCACIRRDKTGPKPSCIHAIQGTESCNTSSWRRVILGVFDNPQSAANNC